VQGEEAGVGELVAGQGIGGALMLPTSLSLLNATFRGRDRGIAFGIWGATIGGTAALGPLLGGWLTTTFSWRWAFGINIPLGAIVIVGLFLLVDESRDPAAARGVDWRGAILSTVDCRLRCRPIAAPSPLATKLPVASASASRTTPVWKAE
jgi:MFS family permease